MTSWRNYLDSININPKDFDGYPIFSQKTAMYNLSKGNSIWGSVLIDDIVQIQKYYKEFIFQFKHHMQNEE